MKKSKLKARRVALEDAQVYVDVLLADLEARRAVGRIGLGRIVLRGGLDRGLCRCLRERSDSAHRQGRSQSEDHGVAQAKPPAARDATTAQ